MDTVNGAMELLRQAITKGKKVKGLAERVDSLTATLRLLDTSLTTDSQIFGKLVTAVREPFIPLYEKFPFQTFQLSAAIFSFLFQEKLVMHLTAGNKALQSNWEGVAESILSGVMDFLETRSDSATLRTLASALYPVLCRICFSTAFCSSITMGSNLRYTAFMLLVDSAHEPTNKKILRDPEYLGSRRLGATLYGSKDYVILENLLLLVLLVAPKFDVMDERTNFMREVFVTNYPEDAICGENLARILAKPTEKDSDLLQAQVIELLAQSNLMFPQPFDVPHIDSCGLRFPQKPPRQRLIMDYKSLLANVIKDEGYESFRVSYDQICGVTFSAMDNKSVMRVVVRTSSAPTIQLRPLKVPDGQSPSVVFEIMKNDALRFKRTLRSRGIAVPPHISVSKEDPRLEFDQEGNTVPDILVSVPKAQKIEHAMQLDQRSDDSPQGRVPEDPLLANESPASPSIWSVGANPRGPITTPSRSIPAPSLVSSNFQVSRGTLVVTKTATTLLNTKLADVTPPHPKAPRQPSVFVPATPSQNKHKDVFGSGDTDLSELSDDSGADSMEALSQKLAARTNSLIAITKRASVLIDPVSPVGFSGKGAAKRRVLDSDDEEVLLSSRNGANGGSRPRAGRATKATVIPDEDDLPPPPAPLKKKRTKPAKKNPVPLNEDKKRLVKDNKGQKRKREDNGETGGTPGAQAKPPPVKRARKTAGGKPVAAKPKDFSPVPAPTPPRDSQVLRKNRPAVKKNANYGRRVKAVRTSSPTRDSVALADGDESTGTLDSKTGPVEHQVDPSPVDNADDDDYVPPPAQKPKLKQRAAAKPKSTVVEESAPPENLNATAVKKTKAKTLAGTRTRVSATKAKGGDDGKTKEDLPKKANANSKKKQAGELADDKGEGTTEVESAKNPPVIIEVPSSPLEPPKPEPKPVSRVIVEQEREEHAPKTDVRTKGRPAPRRISLSKGEGDEEVTAGPAAVVVIPAPPLVRSTPIEVGTKMPVKPISEQVVVMSTEQKGDDRTSESTKAERLPVTRLLVTNDSHLVEANPAVVAPGVINREIEVEMEEDNETAVVDAWVSHEMDLDPDRFDPIVVKSPAKIRSGGAKKKTPVRFREPVGSEELRSLEVNTDDGESPDGGIHGFTLSQPIMDRMVDDVSTPKERLRTMADTGVIAQSTPTTLPRGHQQSVRLKSKKPKVTFATIPFKGKDRACATQTEITPRSGAQWRAIFEDDRPGMSSTWKRPPAKSSDKHSALIGVLNEIQDVITKQVTNQFEVAEEEARFARNEVHDEALTDFKKMYSQRTMQFNALVDLETAYATRERRLVAGYEVVLAANAEFLGHIRQKIKEHDETNLVGKLPKTLRKSPMSALMNSYLE